MYKTTVILVLVAMLLVMGGIAFDIALASPKAEPYTSIAVIAGVVLAVGALGYEIITSANAKRNAPKKLVPVPQKRVLPTQQTSPAASHKS